MNQQVKVANENPSDIILTKHRISSIADTIVCTSKVGDKNKTRIHMHTTIGYYCTNNNNLRDEALAGAGAEGFLGSKPGVIPSSSGGNLQSYYRHSVIQYRTNE